MLFDKQPPTIFLTPAYCWIPHKALSASNWHRIHYRFIFVEIGKHFCLQTAHQARHKDINPLFPQHTGHIEQHPVTAGLAKIADGKTLYPAVESRGRYYR